MPPVGGSPIGGLPLGGPPVVGPPFGGPPLGRWPVGGIYFYPIRFVIPSRIAMSQNMI